MGRHQSQSGEHEHATRPVMASETNHTGEDQGSTRHALLEDLLYRGPGQWLRFPEPLEQQFRHYNSLEGASLFRSAGFYVLALFVALGCGLLIVLPREVLGLWPLGYSTLALVILAAIILTRRRRLDPWYETIAGTLAFLGIAIVTTLPALSDAELMRQSAMIGIIHACVVVGGMLGLRCLSVIQAVVGGGLAGLVMLHALDAAPPWLVIHQTVSAGALVAIVLAWLAEHRNRQVFLQKRLLALEKARSDSLAERMKEMSRHDGLTGLANRRHFDEVLDQEWRRCQRDGASLSLVFIDVDFFKPYNDHYGHQAGDEVLRRVGAIFAGYGRRPGDLAARYGGEEFVLLYPRTGPDALSQVAEQIRATVERLGLPHEHSDCAGQITVSIGTASVIPETNRTAEELVKTADRAVYQAKREGRNRVKNFQLR